jgi:ribose transport system ATP-binding protein
MKNKLMIEAKGLSKRYGGNIALENVDIQLKEGSIIGLIGENGAGKSTLVKLLSGDIAPDSGQIRTYGQGLDSESTKTYSGDDIRVIHQVPALASDLTISDNIFLGCEEKKTNRFIRLAQVDYQKQIERIKPFLKRYAPHLDPNSKVSTVKPSELRIISIIKALIHSAQVLIMDEPTAALPASERVKLLETTKELRKQGISILYVSHYLEEIEELADEVVVLRDGKCVGHIKSKPTVDQMISLMVGRSIKNISDMYQLRRQKSQQNRKSDGWKFQITPPGLLKQNTSEIEKTVNYECFSGEIALITGLVGSGIQEIADASFGMLSNWNSKVTYHNNHYKVNNPNSAISIGIGYLPDDRSRMGLIPDFSICQNISIASLKKITGIGQNLQKRSERDQIKKLGDALKLKRTNDEQKITELSGGNQQKAMLGRWLFSDSQFLILNEPTQGIDLMAKAEIMQLLANYVDNGGAVLIVTTEAEEFLTVASRVFVMRRGQFVNTLIDDQIKYATLRESMLVKSI